MQDAASEPEPTGDGAAPRVSLGKGRALVPVPRPALKAEAFAGLGRSHGVVAAGVAVVMGIGFVAGTAAFASRPQGAVLAQASPSLPVSFSGAPQASTASSSAPSANPPVEAGSDALSRVQGEVRALRASLDGLRAAAADDDRQADIVRGLKRAVDGLKQEVEGVKVASSGAVGQLGAKVDRLDRDPGSKLTELSARLDRLEREPDPKVGDAKAADAKAAEAKAGDVRLAEARGEARIAQVASQLTARLDRLERQVAVGDATGSIPRDAAAQLRAPLPPQRSVQAVSPSAAQPATPGGVQNAAQGSAPAPAGQTAAQPNPMGAVAALPPPRPEPVKPEPARSEAAKPEAARTETSRPEAVARADLGPAPRQPDAPPKPATLDGWLLRDVYGGVALVEGRAGGLREVAPGEYVPGVGEIRSIERRGRGWVVVTSRGLIQADNRW